MAFRSKCRCGSKNVEGRTEQPFISTSYILHSPLNTFLNPKLQIKVEQEKLQREAVMKIYATRLLGILLIVSLAGCVNSPILQFGFIGFLPVLYIVENPVNPTRAKLLADALGIDANIMAADGSIRYLNKERFQALPMVPRGVGINDEDGNLVTQESFDFNAIKILKPLSDADVLTKATAALEYAGLNPQGGEAKIGHSRFEAVDTGGGVVADVLVDTHIDFETVTPNGYPLKGPGADIKIVFDGAGVVTQLHYAFRTLTEGSRESIVSLQQAKHRAAAEYFDVDEGQISVQGQCASAQGQLGTLCLESELVYYAPPIELEITQVLPHYLFTGNFEVDGKSIEVRKLLIPAVENVMEVSLSMTTDGSNAIQAEASVTGGRGPYQYAWSSSSTALALSEQAAKLSYVVAGREAVLRETLSVVVSDADGVSAWTSQAAKVNAPAPTSLQAQQIANVSVGSQWVGLSQNLPYSKDNAAGFLHEASQSGIAVAFNYGDEAAFQRDFAKATDEFGVDSVDMTFYTGHASGLGFTFASDRDRRMFYADQASWGETDLEWLVIAACGPLQETDFGIKWWQQWGKAFNGLHLMLGYANTTYDNNREGRLLGQEMFENALTIRQAWANAATSIQTPNEIYAVMGVWDEAGFNNYNDHFWNLGPVGPDIPALNIGGYWRLSGPS